MASWLTSKIRKYKGYLIPDSQEKINKEAYDYWNKTDNDTADMSHWKETGRWEDEQVWEAVGDEHLEMFQQLLQHQNYNGKMKVMAEWGPGGAANLSKFSKVFDEIYGIDISVPNLDKCKDELKKRNFTNFKSIHIEIDNPESVYNSIQKESLDFFLCTAVYQHFPGQEFGNRVTKIAYDLIRPGGFAIIQTRYNNGAKGLNSKKANYQHNILTFTTYFIEEFWDLLINFKFKPLYLSIDPKRRYAYYFIFKP